MSPCEKIEIIPLGAQLGFPHHRGEVLREKKNFTVMMTSLLWPPSGGLAQAGRLRSERENDDRVRSRPAKGAPLSLSGLRAEKS